MQALNKRRLSVVRRTSPQWLSTRCLSIECWGTHPFRPHRTSPWGEILGRASRPERPRGRTDHPDRAGPPDPCSTTRPRAWTALSPFIGAVLLCGNLGPRHDNSPSPYIHRPQAHVDVASISQLASPAGSGFSLFTHVSQSLRSIDRSREHPF